MNANDWYNLLGGNIHHVIYELIGSMVFGILIINFLNPRNWR